MSFLQMIEGAAVLFVVFIAVFGTGGIVVWMSTKNTMSREARVEITTSIVDAIYYAGWRTAHFFSDLDKDAFIRRSVYLLVTTAILAVVTDSLNRGTMTLAGIGKFLLGIILAVLFALGISIWRENKTSNHQRYD